NTNRALYLPDHGNTASIWHPPLSPLFPTRPTTAMPLQKSFSDQNHSSKAKRSQWQKNKSFQGVQQSRPDTTTSSKPLQEKPPVAISTATRNKLNAFQFGPQANSKPEAQSTISLLSDNDKENALMTGRLQHDGVWQRASNTADPQHALVELPAKGVPSTPAGKLALPDLIGMGDLRQTVQDISPDDRIMWDDNKDILSSASTAGRKRKKRARSSSPVPSPAHMAGRYFTKGEGLGQQIDPGFELWGRYSLSTTHDDTPQGLTIPSLAHIMHTSSPQPSKDGATPRSGPTFRRAISCGILMPKRRRVADSTAAIGDVFTEPTNAGPSKLSALIERVQEGFTQSKSLQSDSDTSASSPIENDNRHMGQGSSPIRARTNVVKMATGNMLGRSEHTNSASEQTTATEESLADGNSSDYGDFDDDEFEESMLNAIAPIAAAAYPDSLPSKSQGNIPRNHNYLRPPEPKLEVMANHSGSVASNTSLGDEEGEFGEIDDDLFAAADIEHVVSQYDMQENSAAPESATRPKVKGETVSKQESDGDEFGDDFDDLDFEAVEAAATQSIQQTASSLIPTTPKRAIQRYLVTNVIESEYTEVNGRTNREKAIYPTVIFNTPTNLSHRS
ncbi:DNA replication factor Dna2, partial [Phlyctema vagabunda]